MKLKKNNSFDRNFTDRIKILTTPDHLQYTYVCDLQLSTERLSITECNLTTVSAKMEAQQPFLNVYSTEYGGSKWVECCTIREQDPIYSVLTLFFNICQDVLRLHTLHKKYFDPFFIDSPKKHYTVAYRCLTFQPDGAQCKQRIYT